MGEEILEHLKLAKFACQRVEDLEMEFELLGLYLFILFKGRLFRSELLKITQSSRARATIDRRLRVLTQMRFLRKIEVGTKILYKANSASELLKNVESAQNVVTTPLSSTSNIISRRLANRRLRKDIKDDPLLYRSIHYSEIRNFVKELRKAFPKGWDVGALPPKRRWAGIRELKNTLSDKRHNRIKDYVRYFHRKLFHGEVDNFNWAIFVDPRMIHYFKTSEKERIADYLNSHPKEKWADDEYDAKYSYQRMLKSMKKSRGKK